MAPVEETLATEYPDFDPYPFGPQNWAQQLVRSILLAEPMAKDFEDCFTGIDNDETVIALANSFSFGNCVRRQRLAEVIMSRTARLNSLTVAGVSPSAGAQSRPRTRLRPPCVNQLKEEQPVLQGRWRRPDWPSEKDRQQEVFRGFLSFELGGRW